MTNDEMPNVIWVHWTLDYVSDVNEDGQCIKYHRAQEPIEGLREADIEALAKFKKRYPTWWYKIGWCDVSRDFDCAPQGHSPEIVNIKKSGDCWDAGFSCDHRGTLADAINDVMEQIQAAKQQLEMEG